MARPATVSVILSTYNQPEWLEKVLWGYESQTRKPDEIVIADDGSTSETIDTIRRLERELSIPLRHVWQEDKGFRKTRILNRALEMASSEYVILSDGDCIPRADFVAQHLALARERTLLSGGYLKLSMEVSRRIRIEDIRSGRAFDVAWLNSHGAAAGLRLHRLRFPHWLSRISDALTPTRASWNGHNASTWRAELLAVNGFDERMAYGGEDRELGERLQRNGVRAKRIRHRAMCVHLDHPRGYVRTAAVSFNRQLRAHNARRGVTRTGFGIGSVLDPQAPLPVSLIVITKNEESTIRRCLLSVPFAAEKLVVDSGSTDRTVEIAADAGARVIENPWPGYGQQRNFAAAQAGFDWILMLDADEWLTPELARELQILLPDLVESEHAGAFLPRTGVFMGRPLRFYRPMVREWKARLYHRNRARWTEPAVHEKLELNDRAPRASAVLLHEFCRDSHEHQRRLLQYGELKAREAVHQGKRVAAWTLPLAYPIAFAKRALFDLGALDGIRGLIIAHNEALDAAFKKIRVYERGRVGRPESDSERPDGSEPAPADEVGRKPRRALLAAAVSQTSASTKHPRLSPDSPREGTDGKNASERNLDTSPK